MRKFFLLNLLFYCCSFLFIFVYCENATLSPTITAKTNLTENTETMLKNDTETTTTLNNTENPDNNICGEDWVLINGSSKHHKLPQKCIKLIPNLLANYKQALSYCNNEDDESGYSNNQLLSINSPKEQDLIGKYLFDEKSLKDNVWLGAAYDTTRKAWAWDNGLGSVIFEVDDDTKDNSGNSNLNRDNYIDENDVDGSSPYHPKFGKLNKNSHFSNWMDGYPKEHSIDFCLEINGGELFKEVWGQWADEKCSKHNAVVCERKVGEEVLVEDEKIPITNENILIEDEKIKNIFNLSDEEKKFILDGSDEVKKNYFEELDKYKKFNYDGFDNENPNYISSDYWDWKSQNSPENEFVNPWSKNEKPNYYNPQFSKFKDSFDYNEYNYESNDYF